MQHIQTDQYNSDIGYQIQQFMLQPLCKFWFWCCHVSTTLTVPGVLDMVQYVPPLQLTSTSVKMVVRFSILCHDPIINFWFWYCHVSTTPYTTSVLCWWQHNQQYSHNNEYERCEESWKWGFKRQKEKASAGKIWHTGSWVQKSPTPVPAGSPLNSSWDLSAPPHCLTIHYHYVHLLHSHHHHHI